MHGTGKGGAPHPFSNAFKGPSVNSLRYNTSQKGSPLFKVYGTQRASVNLLDGFGFSTNAGGKKGGKGGGGKSGGKKGGNQAYSVNVAFGLCQGPVSFSGAPLGASGNNRVWADAGVGNTGTVPLSYYAGIDGQAPDPVFEGAPNEAFHLGYSGTAYVTGTPLQLGSSPTLPNISFEISGFGSSAWASRFSLDETGSPYLASGCGPSFPGDANPSFIVADLLLNTRDGAGFPAGNLDSGGSLADFAVYCQASQLAMSYTMDRQQPVARWLQEITDLTVAAVCWSGTLLKLIPYGDSAISANGATWTPNLAWQYSLGDSDFLAWSGSAGLGGSRIGEDDPVLITRTDPAAVSNWLGVEYQDTNYAYNQEVVPSFDQAAIDQFGLVVEPSVQAYCFTNPTSAQLSGQLQLQRKQYVRNTYKFKLGWRYSLLEPMDIVLITDATLGLSGAAVRITQIDEDDNGELTVTAEEIPGITP